MLAPVFAGNRLIATHLTMPRPRNLPFLHYLQQKLHLPLCSSTTRPILPHRKKNKPTQRTQKSVSPLTLSLSISTNFRLGVRPNVKIKMVAIERYSDVRLLTPIVITLTTSIEVRVKQRSGVCLSVCLSVACLSVLFSPHYRRLHRSASTSHPRRG